MMDIRLGASVLAITGAVSAGLFSPQKNPLAQAIDACARGGSGVQSVRFGAPAASGNLFSHFQRRDGQGGDSNSAGPAGSDKNSLSGMMDRLISAIKSVISALPGGRGPWLSPLSQGVPAAGKEAANSTSATTAPAASTTVSDAALSASGASGAAGTNAAAPASGAAAPTAAGSTAAPPTGDSSARRAINLYNDGDKPLTFTFTNNPAQGAPPAPVTVQPGAMKTQEFSAGWNGNVRTTAGNGQNPTLGEVAFDGGGGKTFYDVGYIEGYNTRMTLGEAGGGAKVSGTLDDLSRGAPDSIKAAGSVGLKKTTDAEAVDNNVVSFLRQKVPNGQGYIVPKDDASTLATASRQLDLHAGALS